MCACVHVCMYACMHVISCIYGYVCVCNVYVYCVCVYVVCVCVCVCMYMYVYVHTYVYVYVCGLYVYVYEYEYVYVYVCVWVYGCMGVYAWNCMELHGIVELCGIVKIHEYYMDGHVMTFMEIVQFCVIELGVSASPANPFPRSEQQKAIISWDPKIQKSIALKCIGCRPVLVVAVLRVKKNRGEMGVRFQTFKSSFKHCGHKRLFLPGLWYRYRWYRFQNMTTNCGRVKCLEDLDQHARHLAKWTNQIERWDPSHPSIICWKRTRKGCYLS